MGPGTSDAEQAAAGLHLLDTHYRRHPDHGPRDRRATSVTPGTPLNVDIVDHIDRCVAEVVHHTRAETPAPAGPPPARVADIYDWYRQHTAEAGPEAQLRRDIVIHRQALEHAIAIGDHQVIRRYPCPACNTWGLMWQRELKRALCPNIYCRNTHGMAQTWALARLATQYVMTEEKKRARRAT